MDLLFSLIKGAPSLFIIALLLGILTHLRNKSTKSFEKSKEDFWERERNANAVRKKDISNLPYVEIPENIISIAQEYDDSDNLMVSSFAADLSSLKDKKILNLNGKSNTDIKLEYGTANITVLSDADNNYTELISILSRLGASLFENGQLDKAREVLEYSINIESDVLRSYQMMTEIYRQTLSGENALTAIDTLKEKAEKLDSIRKDSILALFREETNQTQDSE